jgi:capsular polysaccharide transport system permease protein
MSLPYKIETVELIEHPRNPLGINPPLLSNLQQPRLYPKILFLLVVILPVALASAYYLFFASPIYESESKFIVRSPGVSSVVGLPSVAEGSGMPGVNSDMAVINNFLTSRDALDLLRNKAGLDQAYGAPTIDTISRFPGVLWQNSDEDLLDYFRQMVSVHFDKSSQISTLTVKAFSPEGALKQSEHLLKSGEELANRLSERMRFDMVKQANTELKLSEDAITVVQDKIAKWRNRNKQIDPMRFSSAVAEVIAKMSLDLATVKTQRATLEKTAPKNLQINQFNIRIKALESQINEEWLKLAGGNNSLSTEIAEYEKMLLEYQVAQRVYSLARASLVVARSESQQNQTYLVLVNKPQLPGYAKYPKSMLNILIVSILCFCLYMILRKLVDNIVRHGAVSRYTTYRPEAG